MEDNLVPADIVKLIFEQTQKSIESNTVTVKDMTEAVNELARIISYPPTKQNILDEVKSHEEKSADRKKETCDILDDLFDEDDKKNCLVKMDLDKQFTSLNDSVVEIGKDVKSLKNKVLTMITVVLIAFGLISIIYIFVNNSVNSNIKQLIKTEMVEQQKYINNNNGVKK